VGEGKWEGQKNAEDESAYVGRNRGYLELIGRDCREDRLWLSRKRGIVLNGERVPANALHIT
jgi:hypothetical protein